MDLWWLPSPHAQVVYGVQSLPAPTCGLDLQRDLDGGALRVVRRGMGPSRSLPPPNVQPYVKPTPVCRSQCYRVSKPHKEHLLRIQRTMTEVVPVPAIDIWVRREG